ncbi:SCO-spondin-like, partial [Oxyura jamaicensis]|uniref:SCO-spondin-like n=1 Tax=Oxyura jamaicensis TaxID=8884 RepID=UPI0015A669BA
EEPWGEWSPWGPCSVSCGGGEQLRRRDCPPPGGCPGLALQSKTCNTHVCREAGCPPGRLYRECQQGEGCPYSCAHLAGRIACFPGGCQEGCHCPAGTLLHRGQCLQECPCVLTAEVLRELQNSSADPQEPPTLLGTQGPPLTLDQEVPSGSALHSSCTTCTCLHGRLNCSQPLCPRDGGFAPWGPWSSCSRSCGGLGVRTRQRGCTSPSPAQGGRDCAGPRSDSKYCQSPECPAVAVPTKEPSPSVPGAEEEEGFGPWSPWSPCSKTCTRPERPATKTRERFCTGATNCSGESFQEQPCNLPHCSDAPPCQGEDCAGLNCSWTPWGPWAECSRSCGVGLQQRLRAYSPPGTGGRWCPGILSAYVQRRFCNLQACKVDGAWSAWSPWSHCDRTCGGGRAVRSRSCPPSPPQERGAALPRRAAPPAPLQPPALRGRLPPRHGPGALRQPLPAALRGPAGGHRLRGPGALRARLPLPQRHPGAGRGLRAPRALRVHRRPGPRLGAGQHPPPRLQQLHVPGRPPALHRPPLPAAALPLEPLVPLVPVQRHLRGRPADALQDPHVRLVGRGVPGGARGEPGLRRGALPAPVPPGGLGEAPGGHVAAGRVPAVHLHPGGHGLRGRLLCRARAVHVGRVEPLFPDLWHRPGHPGGLLPLPDPRDPRCPLQ